MKCGKPLNIVDKHTAGRLTVPCGRCTACRLNFRSFWAQRMMNEKLFWDESVFVTWTYEKMPKDGNLCKRDVQLMLKRLRKELHPKKLKYYIGGEYGDRDQRPHYHGILFGLSARDVKIIESTWGQGFIYVGTVTDDSCNYVAKYINKKLFGADALHYKLAGVVPEFSIMSRGGRNGADGIGTAYVKKYKNELRNRGYAYVKGNKAPLPRFYKDKIYADDKGRVVREQRRLQFDSDNIRKRLDTIKKIGYSGADREELLSRQKVEIDAVAKINLKRSRL